MLEQSGAIFPRTLVFDRRWRQRAEGSKRIGVAHLIFATTLGVFTRPLALGHHALSSLGAGLSLLGIGAAIDHRG